MKTKFWREELKFLLDNSRTGLKESSDTNKTYNAIFALFEDIIDHSVTIAVEEFAKKVEEEVIGFNFPERIIHSHSDIFEIKDINEAPVKNKLLEEQRQKLEVIKTK